MNCVQFIRQAGMRTRGYWPAGGQIRKGQVPESSVSFESGHEAHPAKQRAWMVLEDNINGDWEMNKEIIALAIGITLAILKKTGK